MLKLVPGRPIVSGQPFFFRYDISIVTYRYRYLPLKMKFRWNNWFLSDFKYGTVRYWSTSETVRRDSPKGLREEPSQYISSRKKFSCHEAQTSHSLIYILIVFPCFRILAKTLTRSIITATTFVQYYVRYRTSLIDDDFFVCHKYFTGLILPYRYLKDIFCDRIYY